jgi:hypothetical protein
MVTKHVRLTSVGEESALVLDQETLDALGWTAETEVDLRVDNGALDRSTLGSDLRVSRLLSLRQGRRF